MNLLLRRVIQVPLVALLVASLCFFLMRLLPGSPFDRERAGSAAARVAMDARYHLDQPLPMQYLYWLGEVLRGDLGPSLKYRSHTVNDILAQTLPVSGMLGLLAFGVAMGVGLPVGAWAALRPGSWADWGGAFLVLLGVCVPSFIVGPVLVLVFALKLGWFPAALWGGFMNSVLPVVALGLFFAARVGRLTREGVGEALRSEFIRAVRAKGLSDSQILIRHAFRLGFMPVLSYCGPMLADLLTGSFVVETVFQIPGTGTFFINAFNNKDYTMIVGITLVYAVLLLGLNLVVDLLYVWLDPRVRRGDFA